MKKLILQEGMFVVAPNEGTKEQFTKGEKYKVSCVDNLQPTTFHIVDNYGRWTMCLLNYCSHIKHENWAILPN